MIEINDCFRVVAREHWRLGMRWVCQEWMPTDGDAAGRWKPVTPGLDKATMRRFLLRHDCPRPALEAFDAA